MQVEIAQVVVGAAVAAVTWIVYKLFWAPIVPSNSNWETLPGPPQPLGKFIGSFPHSPFLEQHKHLLDLGKRYGLMVRKRVLARNVMIVVDPQVARNIVKDREAFPERAPNGINIIMPRGLLALPTGDDWKHHRKLVSLMFADRYIRAYNEVFVSKSLELIKQLNEGDSTKSFNFHEAVSKLSLDAIGVSGFGYDFHSLESGDATYFDAATGLNIGAVMRTIIPYEWLYRLVQGRQAIVTDNYLKVYRNLVAEILRKFSERRAALAAEGKDASETNRSLIDILADSDLTENDIVDESMTLVLAGHETTANTMSWAIKLLCENPEVMRKAQAEVDEVMGRPGFEPKDIINEIKQLRYIAAIVQEALRLYPTVPNLPRICVKDTQVNGYDVPAGTIVYIALYAMGRDERNWENALEFRPERFLDKDTDALVEMGYLPFGGGIRMCVGRRFAQTEAVTVLAFLLRHFDFELDTTHPIIENSHITLTTEKGIWVRAKPRKID